jgi:hypothetical protein
MGRYQGTSAVPHVCRTHVTKLRSTNADVYTRMLLLGNACCQRDKLSHLAASAAYASTLSDCTCAVNTPVQTNHMNAVLPDAAYFVSELHGHPRVFPNSIICALDDLRRPY